MTFSPVRSRRRPYLPQLDEQHPGHSDAGPYRPQGAARRRRVALVECCASVARAGGRLQPKRSPRHWRRRAVLLFCRAIARGQAVARLIAAKPIAYRGDGDGFRHITLKTHVSAPKARLNPTRCDTLWSIIQPASGERRDDVGFPYLSRNAALARVPDAACC